MRNIPAISREHGDPRKFPGGIDVEFVMKSPFAGE